MNTSRPSAENHVVVVSQLPPPVHGSSVMTQRLIDSLEEGGFQVDLVQRRFSSSVSKIGRPSLKKVLMIWPFLKEILIKTPSSSRAPVIYFGTNRKGSLLVDVAALSLLKWRRKRVINYLHTGGWGDLAGKSPFWKFLARRQLEVSTLVVTLSPRLTEDIRAVSAVTPIREIGNASAEQNVTLERPRDAVLFLSNLIAGKGYLEFLEVAKALHEKHPDTSWLLAGGGLSEDRSREFSAMLASRYPFVTHLGSVTSSERDVLLRRSKMLLFPSTYKFEAQPLTIIEAQSWGVPTVAFAVGGVPDVVGSGGAVVPVGRVQELVDVVNELLGDKARLREASARALDSWRTRHSLDIYKATWLELLKEYSA